MDQTHTRNICIIAHIDHGKSTLADRFIEIGNLVNERDAQPQILDSMDIERERGITIKSRAISFPYKDHWINLIDTPGHADFGYEVSRALASCEGAILLIDAKQGVQAQTLSNLYIALESELEIIPVINKIDLDTAEIEQVEEQIRTLLGFDRDKVLRISAKENIHIPEVLDRVLTDVRPPSGTLNAPLRARVFDSVYDSFRGVILYIRMVDGELSAGDVITGWNGTDAYRVEETGVFLLEREPRAKLASGDVGYCIANIKSISDIRVGDTLTTQQHPAKESLGGFQQIAPVIYSSLYPIHNEDQDRLKEVVQKLQLNDASFVFETESSDALGMGFRCGFLGMLHLEIVQERLQREYDLPILLTAPSVRYEVELVNGQTCVISNAQLYPTHEKIAETKEPFVQLVIITPAEYIGKMLQLCSVKRGSHTATHYLDAQRAELIFEIPLAEILYDFYDRLKSATSGYASFGYTVIDSRPVQLARVSILVAGNRVDALSFLIVREHATPRARAICSMLKQYIPRHQFTIAIQGAIGSTVIARETIPAFRKDVTAKLYGGDITRKKKLLQKQKKGKKRLKMVGQVNIPQEAFLASLKSGI